MNVKMFNKIVKDEKLKNDSQIKIKISYVDAEQTHRTKIVETEGYKITPEGIEIGCYFGECK